jgi:hypothetical protein
MKKGPRGPLFHSLAVEVVITEPSSAGNSLINRENTGNSHGFQRRLPTNPPITACFRGTSDHKQHIQSREFLAA